MGSEVRTTMRVGRQSFAGTAHLESSELLFRGDARVRIPFNTIKDVSAKSGALHITHAEGRVSFELGDNVAGKWAEKIKSPRSLSDKLGVKSGMTVAMLGVADPTVHEELTAKGAKLVARVPANAAMVLWRVTKSTDLAKLPRIVEKLAPDGAVWVVHPRGEPAVADTVIFGAAKAAGLTYTKVLRFSETDTAEKLVIPRSARLPSSKT